MKKEETPVSLCFRCDHRAVFLEQGYGPRCECKDTSLSVHGCYMYRPVRPVTLRRSATAHRFQPVLGPSMIAARMQSVGLWEDAQLGVAVKRRKGKAVEYTPYWRPKQDD